MNIKDLPKDARPQEKLIAHGPTALSDSELLAIILRTGSKKENVLSLSNRLLTKFDLKKLSRTRISTLKKSLGVGDTKAAQITACFELGRRLAKFKEYKNKTVNGAQEVAKIFMPEMSSLRNEQFKVLYLNTKKRIITTETLFIGSLNESLISPREIFQIALEEGAAALILIHNHPSGDPTPSEEDITLTKNLFTAGQLLGVEVVDHIIIGAGTYTSLRQKGLL